MIMPSKELQLWDWQDESVQQLRAGIKAGQMNQILAAPTGSGKTVMATHLLQEAEAKGTRSMFICDRLALIDQTSKLFDEYGIPHGIIQSKHWRWQPWRKIQIASAQTLARRKMPEGLGLIVVDEAHTVHRSVARMIEGREVVTIGLTATPFTKGLAKLYDGVVNVRTLNQLTADGYLAPFRAYSASEPDMTGAKVTAGEWTDAEAEKRAMPIIGDAVAEYLKHAPGLKFIAFGVNVRHCEALQKQFLGAGIHAGLYTYRTSDEERTMMVDEFKKPDGYITGLISVAALSKGFDVPSVECLIMCRPLKSSFTEHIQILGRGLRRDPENPDKECIVLDHAGNMVRFWGRMIDFFEHGVHELDDGKRRKKKAEEAKEPAVKKCPVCKHVHSPRPTCPSCGHAYPKPNPIEHIPGELKAMAAGIAANVRDLRQDIYSQLIWIARERGWEDGAAAYRFRDLFGGWPDGLHKDPRPPTAKTQRWVRDKLKEYIESKAQEAAS